MQLMQTYKLGEICEIITGSTPPTKYQEYYGGNFLRACPADLDQGNIVRQTKKTLSEKGVKEGKIRLVPKGGVLVCCIGTIGKCSIAGQDMATNQQINSFVPKEGVLDSKYLLYSIKFHENTFKTKATSTTVPILNKSQCSEISIPLPPLATQHAIADKLDKLQSLIDLKKQAIIKTDELAKSIFLEMFGDPMKNEKGWEVKTIERLISKEKYSLKRGPFGGALKKEIFVNEGYLVYEQFHALNNDFSMARYFIDEERFEELKAFEVKPGDIIVSCSGIYLGKLAIVPKNARKGIINQALLKITLDESKMNKILFTYIFTNEHFKSGFLGNGIGSGIPNFPPMEIFKKFKFIPNFQPFFGLFG